MPSTAPERSSNNVDNLHRMPCIGILDHSPEIAAGDLRLGSLKAVKVRDERETTWDPCTSSSSSSIGRNSDDASGKSSDGDDGELGENEVQSSLKESSFNSAIDALEEALPIRRGISRFYGGKSKSFASLIDASASSSIKDIGKPENAYSRKRKNLLAHTLFWDKKPGSLLRSHWGGISKRPTSSSRSKLGLALATSTSSDSINGESSDSDSNWKIFRPPPSQLSPPMSPLLQRTSSPWRSVSLVDLQQCSGAAHCSNSS
ncbi:hypothetical protein Nepgr_013660 [Nepenthes gracilis]|uniref:Uncharacterized protein n=1 Tax=Nepenthes gracilis TaxID=150966 RepID=A0AAD3XPD5_NEPGR|nr:hypothetical protein Nepgr_013660 [Nepenthes gracilis]